MLERSRERLKGDTVRKVLLLGLLERGLALSSGLWLCQLLSHGSASSSRERLKGDQLLSQFGISFPYQLSTSISCTFLLTNGLGPPSTRGRYHIHNLYLGVLAVFFFWDYRYTLPCKGLICFKHHFCGFHPNSLTAPTKPPL